MESSRSTDEIKTSGIHEPVSPPPRSAEPRPRVRRLLLRPRRFVWEALTQNVILKLLSLSLAVVLWVLVSGEQNLEESAEIFLDIKRPASLVLLNQPPQSISVRVMGPRSRLKALRSARLEMSVDLSQAKPGEMVYNLVGKRIRNLPGGVDVTAYSPGSLKLQFDERMVRKLPVRAQIEGEPAPGYELGVVDVQPASVTIEGPREALKNLREIPTEAVKVDGARKSLEGRYDLVFHSPSIRVLGGSETVAVRAPVSPLIEVRQFDGIEVIVPETMGRVLLSPETARVVLEGPREALQAITPADVRIFLEEGTIPLAQLHDTNILRYPATPEARGMPRLRVSWPNEEAVKLKRLNPASFQFKVLKGGAGVRGG